MSSFDKSSLGRLHRTCAPGLRYSGVSKIVWSRHGWGTAVDVILDREELHREVWSKSVSAVARKYNLTDGDIRKACFALDVPRPDRGQLTKVKSGEAQPAPQPLRKSGLSTYTCRALSRSSESPVQKPKPKRPAKKKESLVEWVLKNRAEMQAEKSIPTRTQPYGSMHLLPEDMIGLPRFIPLTFWVALLLGEHAPHPNTVLRWVHDARIYPQPIKVGKSWNVRKDAAYMPDQ